MGEFSQNEKRQAGRMPTVSLITEGLVIKSA